VTIFKPGKPCSPFSTNLTGKEPIFGEVIVRVLFCDAKLTTEIHKGSPFDSGISV
jgi:hypothetical protein